MTGYAASIALKTIGACSLDHANIITMHGACMAWPHICIVEELATGGSLHDLLHPTGKDSIALPIGQVRLAALPAQHLSTKTC